MTPHALPTLADLAARPDRVDELAPDEARELLVAIASLQPLLIARALAQGDAGDREDKPDRLLTVPDAAERLAIPASFLYELIRQGRVQAQRIGPKYVRLHPDTVAELQKNGLDGALYGGYSRHREGSGAPGAARATNANGVRRGTRHPVEHGGPVRAGRVANPRDGGAPRSVSGEPGP
jgi:excisionase family DNA binding protein